MNCHVWKFCKDLFLNCRVSSWPDLSIKSYFLMVSSLILLRSLRVDILKQLFFYNYSWPWVLWSMDCLQLPFIHLEEAVFLNSAFPDKKNLAQQRILFMTNKFESKCLQKFYVSSKHDKECYMKTTSYLEEPNRHFCQHFMRRTTQQTFSAINLASQQKPTKLFFS